MVLWKSILAYDGTAFHGWQIQPGLPTVQGSLAQAILHVSGESVLPQGSGRTDTGVHALGQVASFSIAAPIPGPNLHRALNRALPPAIRILSLEPAAPGFHARHSAIGKTYEYRIFPSRPLPLTPIPDPMPLICSPMLAPFVWDCPFQLDLALLQNAADAVLGTHDFTSFAASDPDLATREASTAAPIHATNIRTIHSSTWILSDGLLLYRVTGSGFLHHMVRNLVGTFVEVGCGRIAPNSVPYILSLRDRSAAGPTAPARGLFLIEVNY
ncbi:tRNA pseudouridine(38-40) synthase TruA [Granulicella sp. dw_53]|uniref:tRNA pseudouridine(38-40) synthase TruA n=1 Tax=Granulicella sp. dw_53 TaxID=2719792 RepID=UPI001BD6BEA7|nr:tRNA pseudouridine(38-40) synthase TruA [Granulicella sp. dw_53]